MDRRRNTTPSHGTEETFFIAIDNGRKLVYFFLLPDARMTNVGIDVDFYHEHSRRCGERPTLITGLNNEVRTVDLGTLGAEWAGSGQ